MTEKELAFEYLKFENINFREEIDIHVMMLVSSGRINPNNGWMFWLGKGRSAQPFWSLHQIIDYVNEQGLRRI